MYIFFMKYVTMILVCMIYLSTVTTVSYKCSLDILSNQGVVPVMVSYPGTPV